MEASPEMTLPWRMLLSHRLWIRELGISMAMRAAAAKRKAVLLTLSSVSALANRIMS